MGAFVREFFVQSPVLVLPVIALIIFMSVFAAVMVRVLRMKSGEVDALAHLALGDESGAAKEAYDG